MISPGQASGVSGCRSPVGEPNTVTVWVSNHKIWRNKHELSVTFGNDVKYGLSVGNGGSYGSKVMSIQVQSYAAALSKATGRR